MVALPPSREDEKVVDADDPRIRLLICNDCETIEPLPWFDGPVQYDDTLNFRLAGHRTAEGTPHRGAMATVSEVSWDDTEKRRKILDELNKAKNGGEIGLGSKLYDLRSTYAEDAYKCWQHDHNRTKNCEDYKSDKKKLVPDTRGDRKELGLETKSSARPNTWLCVFCPYHSVVMERARRDQGYY
jgi:hypothetical protein